MKEAKAGKIEIVTDRLIIRTPGEKDVHDIFVLMSDREIAAITGFRPMGTLSEAEGKIRREMDGGLMFCISEKNLPEKVIGVFEITPHKTNTVSGEKCNYEICYFLHKEARGKGYMTEVVTRMKRYLFDERMADSLTIAVLPRNDASRRVALKSGFTYEGLERKCGMNYLDEVVDLEYYTLYKEEYLNPNEKIHKEKQTIALNAPSTSSYLPCNPATMATPSASPPCSALPSSIIVPAWWKSRAATPKPGTTS